MKRPDAATNRPRPHGQSHRRNGLSLVELMTAVVLLGVGLVGLAAGSGWMIGSGEERPEDAARVAALRAAVEEVSALPFEALAPGEKRHGRFEVEWALIEETPDAALLRFVVTGIDSTSSSASAAADARTEVADTLEYRRTRP